MTSFRACASVVAVGVLASILAACGGGYDTSSPSPAAGRYAATILIADTAPASAAARTDAKLVNPWDLAFSGLAAVWVTNNGSSSSTFHDIADPARRLLVGSPFGSTASARPTGVAFNSGNGFEVTTQDGRTGVARFIVASEGGTLSGWAPALGLETAILAFDGSAAAAVYTGLVKTTLQGSDEALLATDFHNRVVDGFGTDFRKLAGADRFVDPALPAGYAPFGILAQGELIHIAYAKQDDRALAPQVGAGLGLVNTFDTAGRLMKRLIPVGESLNAPWGMAIAPANFGALGGALLIANTGDGAIHAFDPASGRSLGALTRPEGAVLAIDGLHRIAFGNGAAGLPTNALFFAAGSDGGRHGVLGRIDLQ